MDWDETTVCAAPGCSGIFSFVRASAAAWGVSLNVLIGPACVRRKRRRHHLGPARGAGMLSEFAPWFDNPCRFIGGYLRASAGKLPFCGPLFEPVLVGRIGTWILLCVRGRCSDRSDDAIHRGGPRGPERRWHKNLRGDAGFPLHSARTSRARHQSTGGGTTFRSRLLTFWIVISGRRVVDRGARKIIPPADSLSQAGV